MGILSRILADGYPSRVVNIRGVDVKVRGATVAEQARFLKESNGDKAARLALLTLCLDPETGDAAFESPAEIEALPFVDAQLLKLTIDELSVLDDEALNAAGKESSPTPTNSATDSD